MDKSHSFLFHETLSFLRQEELQHQKMIVGVSGGLDSMVLLSLLQELSHVCQLELIVSYIHHGHSKNPETNNYRETAEKLVSKACKNSQLPFFSSQSQETLSSEKELRDFRHQEFKKLLKKEKANLIVLAHNQNDLLETRLINLIRGSGFQGLESMTAYKTPYLRPLLEFSREQLQQHALAYKIDFLEDPSNKENSYLRNWIRNKWLQDLETKRTGSVKSLARSLELLSQARNHPSHFEKNPPLDFIFSSDGINRPLFLELPLQDQKRTLAIYIRSLGLSNYGQSHIQELLKHNNRVEKNFKVKLLKKTWIFTKNQIKILE